MGAILSALAALNSTATVISEAVVFGLKQILENTQYQSKADGQKTLASSTPDAKTLRTSPSGSLSPSTLHIGSHKGNESLASGAGVAEQNRPNIRVTSGTQGGGIPRAQSPTSLHGNVHAPHPAPVPLSLADEDATTVEERADGSISPSSDCAFAPPPVQPLIVAPASKKRTTLNARRKTMATDTALDVQNESSEEPQMTFTIASTQKVSAHFCGATWKN